MPKLKSLMQGIKRQKEQFCKILMEDGQTEFGKQNLNYLNGVVDFKFVIFNIMDFNNQKIVENI